MRILHFLGVNLNEITQSIPEIKEQGFDAIQISPVQPFKDQDKKHKWYMLYQPLAFRIGNSYGSKEDLIKLCKGAKEFGVDIYVDVVCNHMANKSKDNPLEVYEEVDEELRNNPYFWKEKKDLSPDDWKDRKKVTHYCMGLPGLDASNYDLQDKIGDFLNELIDCGVSGFRFDAAKSIALPEEHFDGYPDCHFFRRVIKEKLKRDDLFNYGEVIFPDNDEQVSNYQKYIRVLTNYHMEHFPEIVTFYESHDTFLSTGDLGWSKNLSIDEVCRGYSDITSKFKNTIFFNRPNTNMWKRYDVKDANLQKIKAKEKVLDY